MFYQICTDNESSSVPKSHRLFFVILNINFQKLYNLITGNFETHPQNYGKGEKTMFFGFSDRAYKSGDGRVDMWEVVEELYAYDSIMGTIISEFVQKMMKMNQ